MADPSAAAKQPLRSEAGDVELGHGTTHSGDSGAPRIVFEVPREEKEEDDVEVDELAPATLQARLTKLEGQLQGLTRRNMNFSAVNSRMSVNAQPEDFTNVMSMKMPADINGGWQNLEIEEADDARRESSPANAVFSAQTRANTVNDAVEMKAQLRHAPPASQICKTFWSACCGACLLMFVMLGVADHGVLRQPMFTNTTDLPFLGAEGAALAFDIGRERHGVYRAAILVALASLGSVFAVMVAAFIIACNPGKTPPEFWRKGTLSNVVQDVSTPHGRIYCVNLLLAALLSLISMYPFWLYRTWIPGLKQETNPLGHHAFQPQLEVCIRCFWVTVPFVGLIVVATIPPTPVYDGYRAAQTWFHNACAPGSMGMLCFFEFLQLVYGEHALQFFFSNEDVYPPFYGPLTTFQRARVLVALLAFCTCLPFAVFQMYLLGGEAGAWKAHSSYNRALMSFYSEIIGMVSIFFLPLLAAVEEVLLQESRGAVIVEAKQMMKYGPWHEV